MPPPGTRTLVHNKPQNRETWAPHGKEGWYIRPDIRNHHCLIYYIPKTASEQVSDMTDISPAQNQLPIPFLADAVTHTSADLT